MSVTRTSSVHPLTAHPACLIPTITSSSSSFPWRLRVVTNCSLCPWCLRTPVNQSLTPYLSHRLQISAQTHKHVAGFAPAAAITGAVLQNSCQTHIWANLVPCKVLARFYKTRHWGKISTSTWPGCCAHRRVTFWCLNWLRSGTQEQLLLFLTALQY